MDELEQRLDNKYVSLITSFEKRVVDQVTSQMDTISEQLRKLSSQNVTEILSSQKQRSYLLKNYLLKT